MIAMAKSDQLENLPARAREVLDAVEGFGREWTPRQPIAHALGLRKLGPAEVTMLDVLVAQGLVEKRETPTDAPSGMRWEYRSRQ